MNKRLFFLINIPILALIFLLGFITFSGWVYLPLGIILSVSLFISPFLLLIKSVNYIREKKEHLTYYGIASLTISIIGIIVIVGNIGFGSYENGVLTNSIIFPLGIIGLLSMIRLVYCIFASIVLIYFGEREKGKKK